MSGFCVMELVLLFTSLSLEQMDFVVVLVFFMHTMRCSEASK